MGNLDSGRIVIDSAGKKKQRSSSYFKYMKNEKMRNKTVSTRCKPKDFKRVVSRLSKMKAAAVSDMGMGNLTMIGCTILHRPLIQMLAEKFNPVNNSIQIHGQIFSITESDFRRIMGIADGGSNIDNTGSMEDSYFAEFVDTFGGNKNEITIEQLKEIVEGRDEVDDTFRIAFFMYTLATILCPGASKRVDPKLLLPLRDTKVLDMKNWAHFLFQKLIEGLKAFKNNVSDYLTGCIIFLQLFYVDVVGHSTILVDKGAVPVVAWGNWEVKRLIEWVERNGGFDSLTVFVSKQITAKMGGKSPEYALHPNLDIHKMDGFRVDLEAVKMELAYLSCTVAHMEAELSSLRKKVGLIEKSFANFKDEIVRLVVAKVLESRKEESRGMSLLHEHIEQPTNKSKRKHDDSEGGKERKSSEGGTSQSLVVLSYQDGQAAEKLRAQAKAKVGADKRLNVADNVGSNCSTRPPFPKSKSQKTKYSTASGSRHTDPDFVGEELVLRRRSSRNKRPGPLLLAPFWDENPNRKGRITRYNPLLAAPKKLRDDLVEIVEKWKKNPRFLINVANNLVDRQFILDIIEVGVWLSFVHVDIGLSLLRKRCTEYPSIFGANWTTTDHSFSKFVISDYNKFKNLSDMTTWCPDTRLEQYVKGIRPSFSHPWDEIDIIYMPFLVSENHWLFIAIDLVNGSMKVYDSRINLLTEDELMDQLRPLIVMFPYLLSKFGVFEKRTNRTGLLSPWPGCAWPISRVENVPQQTTDDCGVYTIKFIDCLTVKFDLSNWSKHDIQSIRVRLAAEFMLGSASL